MVRGSAGWAFGGALVGNEDARIAKATAGRIICNGRAMSCVLECLQWVAVALSDQLDLAWPPLFGEEGLNGAVQSKYRVPALGRISLNPIGLLKASSVRQKPANSTQST